MIHQSHLKTAVRILETYTGAQPFSLFIKEFFRADKKYGSRDRRQVSRLCYSFFRIGRLAPDWSAEDRILLGVFLCGNTEDEFQPDLKPAWAGHFGDSLEVKCRVAGISYSPGFHFPLTEAISGNIDKDAFTASHLVQPDLFIRVRPGNPEKIHQQLTAAGIPYRDIPPAAIAFANSTKLETVIAADRDAVIQDLSSQRVARMFPEAGGRVLKVWDCCAASGGKSIMAIDQLGSIDLTVSDLRQNILVNLQQRFERAGIRKFRSLVTDLGAGPATGKGLRGFDLVIADVPCSGSGTWGRTPEHLVFFTASRLEHYQSLQKKIIDNSLPSLGEQGHYLYITCSVYRNENEDAVEYIRSKGLTLQQSGYLKGYSEKADTLFAALFAKA